MFAPIPRIVPLFLVACTGFFSSCMPWSGPEDGPAGLRAYFLDVGQGDACLLRTPGNRWFLNDIGNDEKGLIGFLRHVRADTLEAVLITHPDLDHFGALPALLRTFPVKKAYVPEGSSTNPAWLEALRELDVFHVLKVTLHTGDTLSWDGARGRVLWPDPEAALSGNDLSTVVRLEYAGRRLLLTGDIETPAENAILAGHPDLASDILKVAHHGSRTSSGLEFVNAVNPRWAVISCDSSVYGHPHAEALADLRWIMGDSTRILRTDRQGTIGFELGEWGVRWIDAWE